MEWIKENEPPKYSDEDIRDAISIINNGDWWKCIQLTEEPGRPFFKALIIAVTCLEEKLQKGN